MSKAKHSSRGSSCSSCHTTLKPNAKFCHECGTSAGDKPEAKRWSWKNISPAVLIISAGFGLLIAVGIYATENMPPPGSPQPNMAAPPQKAENPVDLSTMSPRQAADRLYNRVMAAEEKGDIDQAKKFAPMALQAYQLLDKPDTDVNYHIGLINLSLGNIDAVRKQIDILKQDSPQHLLGLSLAIDVAKRAGDAKLASDILIQFASAYDAEIKREKAEYKAHRATIEKLHKSTSNLKTTEKTTDMPDQTPNEQESGTQSSDSK